MSAIVLPDGMLAGRRDLRPVNLSSCPPGKRCADACLASHLPSHRTSLIGLLWERENVMSRTSRGDNWKSTLGAVQALNLALWAGSTATADEALMQIAARAERLREDLRLTVVESALAISRGVTSRGTRRDVAADILPASIADFEYDMGVATPPRVVSLDAFLRGDTSPEEPYEVFFRGNGYSGTGRVIDGRWRSVPTVQAWDAALESGNLQAPLDSASDGLRQMMSRLEQREHEAQTLQSRYIRSGDKSWEVGRERRLALLPHFEKIPPHLRATARAASLRALDGPDCRLMHEFVRRHGDELRRAGVDLGLLDASAHFDWRRLGEATQPASAWAAVDGRISIPL